MKRIKQINARLRQIEFRSYYLIAKCAVGTTYHNIVKYQNEKEELEKEKYELEDELKVLIKTIK